MKCIIIEDQPPAQRILKKYINDIGTLELKATFANALQAMDYLKQQEIDLMFLDIHLPKISGIDFLKSLPNPPAIIMTTAFSEYALESYEYNVVDYLLKPFSFQRFVKAISKISLKNNDPSGIEHEKLQKTIFIKVGYEHVKVNIDEILYIKSDGDYTELFLPDEKYLSSEPLRFWLEKLHENQFVRIHKSYIVNTIKIIKVASRQVSLTGDINIPIGRAYKENFTRRFII